MKYEEYLLICLSEECSEIIKDVSKALRFGLDDKDPFNPRSKTNRIKIINELNDLFGTTTLLTTNRILPQDWLNLSKTTKKRAKIKNFAEYSRKRGILEENQIDAKNLTNP